MQLGRVCEFGNRAVFSYAVVHQLTAETIIVLL
jgi:hypothetical protein